MPFDPNSPQPNTLADADALRAQLNALHDENTALAATVASQDATITAQAAALAALGARVTALETQAGSFATTVQLSDAIATRAPKPTGVSPLSYGASDPPTQGEVQGGFDLLATLITELNAP